MAIGQFVSRPSRAIHNGYVTRAFGETSVDASLAIGSFVVSSLCIGFYGGDRCLAEFMSRKFRSEYGSFESLHTLFRPFFFFLSSLFFNFIAALWRFG